MLDGLTLDEAIEQLRRIREDLPGDTPLQLLYDHAICAHDRVYGFSGTGPVLVLLESTDGDPDEEDGFLPVWLPHG
jgi:hypothetical protein